MDSLSRPFHSTKLSNATTKNPYDDVYIKHSKPSSNINIQDYLEIFGNTQASSIPVLDLSTLKDLSFDGLSSSFNSGNIQEYINIFGGFSDQDKDGVVSYEQVFGCHKLREPSSTTPTSQDLDDLSHQSPDGLKKFNMSYNKINQKSRDGLDWTKHVTQSPVVTGFTCFVDEKQNPSAVNVGVDFTTKQPSKNAVRKKVSPLESVANDKKTKTFDVDFKIHPSKVFSSRTNVADSNDNPRRSMNSESCKVDLDEDIDVNSAAFALKKAIEKAQESIRIAKESVGRNKGVRSFSNKKLKNRVKVEADEKKCRDEDSLQSFQDVGKNHKYGEKLLDAKKFINEIQEKIAESNKDSGDTTTVYNATKVTSETKSKPLDSARNDEYATSSSDAADTETIKIQTDNVFVDEHEAEIMASKPTIDILEHQSVVEELESDEINNEVRLSNALELIDELNNLNVSQKEKDEKEVTQDFSQHDDEKQDNVVEYEDGENAESEKHEEIKKASEWVKSENEYKDEEANEMFDGFCERDAKDSVQTCDNKLEESEVSLHDDCEVKQEDDQTVERKGETLDESHEQEFEKSSSDDNVIEETDDLNVETTQDVDDVTEVSSEFQADDHISSDDEDEYEVEYEVEYIINDLGSENDVRSESSSGSTHGMKIIGEESNIQTTNESVNDIKETQEPESSHKEDEIEEPGPSKVSGNDRFRRIAEETATKEREWERNRLAVDRAIREARERAFAEARDRAERERAAVGKATEEVRQRMMAEAHEKVSKASVTNKSSSERTSTQSKLRAERAAVERATSEARQRALEKAVSQKTVSDLNRSESALRTKAKLEKHNRIMERAAKALAEKEKRDRLVQKEQAERNRLAENLDADIKRWSNGKEGNLRALLSTLQYILGPESGWQPVSLTEIITTSAVKKAYRKATLCVHPDKLQQRGATIQQKYLCEKVFDLLKAAWNKFNSVER